MTVLIILFSIQTLFVILKFIKIISSHLMTNILRFSYGAFLIFSAGVKLIDPLGFSYKLEEYFEVFNMSWLIDFSLYISLFVIFLEIFLGICLIYGTYVKKVLWGNLILMVSFTFLTFYSAYFDAVTDCGCFGDFLKLEPWHSFLKDIHLLFISIILFVYQDRINPLFTSSTMSRLLIVDFIVILIFTGYTLSYIPVIDFRAYKLGNNIIEGMKDCDDTQPGKECGGEYPYYFMKNKLTGDTISVSSNNVNFNEYSYVSMDTTRNPLVVKGYVAPIKDFELINPLEEFNMTDSILSLEKVVLIISYDITHASEKGYGVINDYLLNNQCDVPVFGVSSSNLSDIKKTINSNFSFSFLEADATMLKTIIRANPGVLVLEKGVVKNKLHWRSVNEDFCQTVNQ